MPVKTHDRTSQRNEKLQHNQRAKGSKPKRQEGGVRVGVGHFLLGSGILGVR